MLKALEYIDDDSTLNSLISILVCLFPHFQKISANSSDYRENPIFKEFVEKETFFREKLIFITNRGSQYRPENCCATINTILKNPKTGSYYFNLNDLNIILDIIIREI